MPSNEPLLIPGSGDTVAVFRRRITNLLGAGARLAPGQVQGLLDKYEQAVRQAPEDLKMAEDVNDPEYVTLVRSLSDRRRALKMSQHVIAAALGVSQAQISQVERRDKIIRATRYEKWLAVLDRAEKEREQ